MTKKAWCGKHLRLGLSGGDGCMRIMVRCKKRKDTEACGLAGDSRDLCLERDEALN